MNFTAEYQYTFEEYKEATIAVRKSVSRQWKKEHQKGAINSRRGMIATVLFLGLTVCLFFLMRWGGAPAPVKTPSPPVTQIDPLKLLTPFLPWLFIFAFVWFFIFRVRRGQYQTAWDQNPSLQRARSITITDDGLIQTDTTSEVRHSWAHYERFEETPNLFLLFIPKNIAEPIPKRIFTNARELDQFRRLLERNISGPTGAFPVIPIANSNGGENT